MNSPLSKAEPDFLQRLVSRALEEDSAIEPRLPSLFEPTSGSSLDAGVSWQDASALLADEAVEDRADDGKAEAGRPQAKVGPGPTLDRDVLEAETGRRAEPMPLSSQRAATATRRSFPPSPTEKTASAEHRSPKVMDFVTHELHPFVGDEAPHEDRRPVVGSDDREASPPRAADRDLSGMEERTNLPTRMDPDEARGTPVPVSIAAAQRIVVSLPTVPYRLQRDEAPVERPDASAAPIVNVTIGRLEVRAVPAAGATAKPRTARHSAQPMALDDYFKQRRGER